MALLPIDSVIVTCEHGGNHVPAEYAAAFAGRRAALDSHRGFDAGAKELAERFADALRASLITADVTRLLVDLNRSRRHPRLFSEVTRPLPSKARREIVKRYYTPYREAVEAAVRAALVGGRGATREVQTSGRGALRKMPASDRGGARKAPAGGRDAVLHLSVHSFTPVFDGVPRTADVGLLYDPRREGERRLCLAWQASLSTAAPELRVRRNYPYRGVADGLVTHLRRTLRSERYIGVELEVNQRFPLEARREWKRLQAVLIESLADLLPREW